MLTGKTQAVRSYSVLGTLGEIPALAARHGLSVNIGAWLGSDRIRNEREIERAIQLANSHKNVTRVIIGNEVVLRGDLPVGDLVAHLDRVRAATSQPVSTAEPWHVWIAHPELADHVDYIAVHMLPYWEGVAVETAVDYIAGKMDLLEQRFPGKPIVIGEVGWPSEGRTRESAVASQANQALFLRRFLERAAQQGYTYYLMEAFDQPWKEQSEGAVGAYWGVYDADREQKFEFHAPIVRIPQWHVLAARVGDRRGDPALAVLLPQRDAAQPWPQLPCDRRLCHRDAGRLDPLRHVAAVRDRHQRPGQRGTARWHGRRDRACCWPRRTNGRKRTG